MPEYEFIHYRDVQGRPDSVTVDAVIPYNLIINTLPPITKPNIHLNPGTHNILSVAAPTGQLSFKMNNVQEYKEGLTVLITSKKNKNWHHLQSFRSTQHYLTGTYQIEINTVPVTKKTVNIRTNQKTQITIEGPGILNINTTTTGFGSLYVLDDIGQEKWVKDLPDTKKRTTMAIQSGLYNLVFRSKKALGSKYTSIKKFEIKTGQALNLKVF